MGMIMLTIMIMIMITIMIMIMSSSIIYQLIIYDAAALIYHVSSIT